ncbi:MAG: hypothetical protein ACR2NW_06620 [Thermodesulfobacteriota bacterium]
MLSVYLFLIFFILFSFSEAYPGGINLGPLYHPTINSEYDEEYSALGPFIIHRKSKDYSEFGFRPFYHTTTKKRGDVRELEFIYPMASYKEKENFTWFQSMLFLFVYNTETSRSGFKNKELTLFPFIFYNKEEDTENNYFAFFPIYGNLKNKFGTDNVNFFLFPLYMRTENDGGITQSYLWPFISSYSGELEGGKFWPIRGKRRSKDNQFYNEFLFWPIYVKREKEFYGDRFYIKSIFPFYSDSYVHGVSSRGYIWPLYQHTTNHNKNTERWDIPWPIFNITKGETVNQTRIFPFFSKSKRYENDEDGYIMWPVYKYKNIDLDTYRRSKKSFFLIFYKDIKEEPIADGVKPKRKIDLWPLFTYKKDADGYKNFHIFTIFEPFVPSNDRLYRNYSSFWRIFVWEKSADNVTRSSFLWNLVSSYKDDERFVFDIRPIIPLFNYSRHQDNKSWNILGGIIGYGTKGGKNILKFLYIPIKV